MKILEVRMPTAPLAAQRDFWGGVLGLPLVESDPARFTVRAGYTLLTFTASATPPEQDDAPIYHIAFDIPAEDLHAARSWLADRTEVVARDGESIFSHPPSWKSSAVYFFDADGNLCEFIARRRRRIPSPGAFGPASIAGISEIGLPAASVPDLVEELRTVLGLDVWLEADEEFATIGGEDGLFIVVAGGRSWWPTRLRATPASLEVVIEGPVDGQLRTGPYGLRAIRRPTR
jgi:catechol-2,3-dioxygenase